jgi:hypothetical protein
MLSMGLVCRCRRRYLRPLRILRDLTGTEHVFFSF